MHLDQHVSAVLSTALLSHFVNRPDVVRDAVLIRLARSASVELPSSNGVRQIGAAASLAAQEASAQQCPFSADACTAARDEQRRL